MGLKVTTIKRLPEKTGRDFFIYFLDYGWDNELTDAMYRNFDAFAAIAAENRSLLIAGLNRSEFANEVLSWHQINHEPADHLLPAIMIADIEPTELANKTSFEPLQHDKRPPPSNPERFVLIPLREICKTDADVTTLLQTIARNLKSGRVLSKFEIKRVKARGNSTPANMVVLQPNFAGLGVDLKEVFKWSRKQWSAFSRKLPRL